MVRIKPLISSCVDKGMPAISVSDRNNLFALVKFYNAAESAGIKPIIASDVWVVGDNSNEEAIIYKAGWLKHPSTQWLFENTKNYMWLYKHMMGLNEEYKKRYNHKEDHVTIQKLGEILNTPPTNMKNSNVNETEPTPAMPDYCKVKNDSVASYRKYYINEKKRFATWKSPAKIPQWFLEGISQLQEV